jgi:hypothetical protein
MERGGVIAAGWALTFTSQSAAPASWINPHLSTASLMVPLNMSIFPLRIVTVFSAFIKSTAKR